MFSLVIPMYNEAAILPDTLPALNAYMQKNFDDYEILFSDDGSTDGSAELVANCGYPHVRVISYPENRGKGCAVRCGMLAARGDVVLFTDCDLAYGVEAIRMMYDAFSNCSFDVIIGSRNLGKDGYEGYSLLRKIASKVYIQTLCIVGGFSLSDSQCGFKAFTKEAVQKIFPYCQTDGFAFDFEAILIAGRQKLKIGEFPVKIINHRASKIHVLSDSFKMLGDLRRIKKHVRSLSLEE